MFFTFTNSSAVADFSVWFAGPFFVSWAPHDNVLLFGVCLDIRVGHGCSNGTVSFSTHAYNGPHCFGDNRHHGYFTCARAYNTTSFVDTLVFLTRHVRGHFDFSKGLYNDLLTDLSSFSTHLGVVGQSVTHFTMGVHTFVTYFTRCFTGKFGFISFGTMFLNVKVGRVGQLDNGSYAIIGRFVYTHGNEVGG